jgi:hypothetical protein
MTRTPLILALVATAALAGCNQDNHTIGGGTNAGDDQANAAANANVQLPPAIAESKTYRCADNNIVYVDWMADNKTANIRTDKGAIPTQVVAAEPGKPMTAPGGYSLSGSASGSSAKIALPGKSEQSCNT